MNKKPCQNKLAFSLLELSIVLMIISAVMIAVIKTSDLISQSKLTAAGQKTINSPILKIDGLVAWYETTLSKSFVSSEVRDGSAISVWNNIGSSDSKNPNNFTQDLLNSRPLYILNGINGLPVLRFDGSNDFMAMQSFVGIANSDYEIFIVYQSGSSGIQFLLAGETVGQYEIHLNGVGPSYNQPGVRFIVKNASPYADVVLVNPSSPHIVSARVQNNSAINHVDGGTDAVGNTDARSSDTSKLLIGRRMGGGYSLNGNIAEIIIFNRSLSTQERRDVEAYLSEKYQITISNS